MIRKLTYCIIFAALIFFFILQYKTLPPAHSLTAQVMLADETVNLQGATAGITRTVFNNTVVPPENLFWNRYTSVRELNPKYSTVFSLDNLTECHDGKDFIISGDGQALNLIDKKSHESQFLADSGIVITNADSNLFILVEKNGLVFYFYQFIPLENKVIQLKNEIFDAFYTSVTVTKNSFVLSFVNGDIYYYAPFDDRVLNKKWSGSGTPIAYWASTTSQTPYIAFISGWEPQLLTVISKNGAEIGSVKKSNDVSPFCFILDNDDIIYTDGDYVRSLSIQSMTTAAKDKKQPKTQGVLKLSGTPLDWLEFFNRFVFITESKGIMSLVVYDKDAKTFTRKEWRYPLYRLQKITDSGYLAMYNQEMLWIVSAQ